MSINHPCAFRFLTAFSLAIYLCLSSLVESQLADTPINVEEKPNILFILTDDQRWDTLGCYGNRSIQTPHLDRLASQGIRLDQFYVAGPVCCPSRAIFLSGLYPHQNGVRGSGGDLLPGTPTVATYLKQGGYITGFIGKAHLRGDPTKWGFQDYPVYLPVASSKYQNPKLKVNGEIREVNGDITEIFTNSAISFLDRHKNDRWFLWFSPNAPHGPAMKYKEFPYSASDITPPPGWPPKDPFQARNWARYYSTISKLDEQLGRLLKKLDDLGLSKNTFIFFASDNGVMSGSHGFHGKEVWFEESVRVPAIVRWSTKIKPNSVMKSLASSVDFLPTVLEIAGVKGQRIPLEGSSMIPALTGNSNSQKDVFSEVHMDAPEINRYWEMVRSQNFKYVRFHDGEQHLYDLAADPHEQLNLIGSEKHILTVKEMQKKLDDWLKRTPPQIPTMKPASPK